MDKSASWIIAEFMGERVEEYKTPAGSLPCVKIGLAHIPLDAPLYPDYDYAHNWNALMEVINRIEGMGYEVSIHSVLDDAERFYYCSIEAKGYWVQTESSNRIEAVRSAILKFINDPLRKLKANESVVDVGSGVKRVKFSELTVSQMRSALSQIPVNLDQDFIRTIDDRYYFEVFDPSSRHYELHNNQVVVLDKAELERNKTLYGEGHLFRL